MSDQRKGGIAWTDETWNPLRGCSRVSEGCRNCYAESVAARFSGPGQPYEGLVRLSAEGKHGRARWNGTVRFVPEKLAEPLRWSRPRRVFVNSMSDLFHESVPNETVAAIFGVMAASPRHTFQVLTKRPDRAREFFRHVFGLESCEETVARQAAHVAGIVWDSRGSDPYKYTSGNDVSKRRAWPGWPLPNVWLGVSVEDQKTADERIPVLLETPAAVRWVSYEPAIGPVGFGRYISGRKAVAGIVSPSVGFHVVNRLDWIVVGGESGPGARPFDLAWARSTIEQTRQTPCRVFVKQLGAKPIADHANVRGLRWRQVDPRDHGHGDDHILVRLADRKGGDPFEWPEDLRVREWPEVVR